jgi:hypothetical protein
MIRRLLTALGLAAFVGLSALGASAQYYGPRQPPPPARYEHRGAPPGSGYVWVGGYNHWNGHAYVWVGGSYQRPPHYGYHWYPGYYSNRGGVYVWVGGHWGPP